MDRQRRPRRAGASEGIFGLNRNSDFRCAAAVMRHSLVST